MTTRTNAPKHDFDRSSHADVVVIGAGLIGLSIALELHDRGAAVTVVERATPVSGSSIAAAGMLAVDDPHNSPKLHGLSQLSAIQYPLLLRRIAQLCGIEVPFQTHRTIQYLRDGSVRHLAEKSLDPRQLAAALLSAVRSTPIRLLERTQISSERKTAAGFDLLTNTGVTITSPTIVYAAGAWTNEAMSSSVCEPPTVQPRKGQMLRVKLPPTLPLQEVHRSEHIYIVPRTIGPQAGTALLGATVEEAGFNTTVHAQDLEKLRSLAAGLFPALGDRITAPLVEAWAGLRPATPDSLPLIGKLDVPGHYIASGHFRNGILHAPATALVIADLIESKGSALDISTFDPARFTKPGGYAD